MIYNKNEYHIINLLLTYFKNDIPKGKSRRLTHQAEKKANGIVKITKRFESILIE